MIKLCTHFGYQPYASNVFPFVYNDEKQSKTIIWGEEMITEH